jgi:hypothetical protein
MRCLYGGACALVECCCRCLDLVQQVLAAPFDARVIQLMDDISNEVGHPAVSTVLLGIAMCLWSSGVAPQRHQTNHVHRAYCPLGSILQVYHTCRHPTCGHSLIATLVVA